MWAVPWPINTGFDEGSRYNTLLQISVGQEEIDEVRCSMPASSCSIGGITCHCKVVAYFPVPCSR